MMLIRSLNRTSQRRSIHSAAPKVSDNCFHQMSAAQVEFDKKTRRGGCIDSGLPGFNLNNFNYI